MPYILDISEPDLVLKILALIDLSLVGGLIIMVMLRILAQSDHPFWNIPIT